MRAWQQDEYGDASVVRLMEVPEPAVRANEVLIAPAAVGVNNGDTRIMQGEPLLVRPFFGIRRPKERVRGMAVAGTVVAMGREAGGFAVGDRVLAECAGGFAELVAVDGDRVVPVPASVDLLSAAAVPVGAPTAWAALEAAGVTETSGAGKRVLVLGASGGVASFTIALALHRGAHITAVCRASAVDIVRSWGAHDVRARGAVDPLVAGETFDAIIDIAGDRPLRQLRSKLRSGGRAALVSGQGSRVLGPVGRIVRSMFLTRKAARLVPVAQKVDADVLAALLTLVAAGDVAVQVTSVVDFAEVPAALAAVARGDVIGKSVVILRPEIAQKSET